jgi:hypothetical protein
MYFKIVAYLRVVLELHIVTKMLFLSSFYGLFD